MSGVSCDFGQNFQQLNEIPGQSIRLWRDILAAALGWNRTVIAAPTDASKDPVVSDVDLNGWLDLTSGFNVNSSSYATRVHFNTGAQLAAAKATDISFQEISKNIPSRKSELK